MNQWRRCLIIILFFLSLKINGQTDYRPGYYISLENDTVYGLIDYRGDFRNSRLCEFKKDENSEPKQFNPGDITSYRFIDGKYYVSKHVKAKNIDRTVFLEYLVKGKANLYYCRDIEYGQYLIQKEGDSLRILSNKPDTLNIENRGVRIVESYKYKGILKAYLNDCMEILPQIDNVSLDKKSLISVAKKYHDYICEGEKCIVYEKTVPVVTARFAPFLGLSVSEFGFDNFEFYENLNFDKSFGPVIGVLFDFSAPKLSEKLSLQINLSTKKNHYYGTYNILSRYYYFHMHSIYLQPALLLKYIYPKGKLRPTAAFGGILSTFLKKDIRLIEEKTQLGVVISTLESSPAPVAKSFLGAIFQIGCDLETKSKRSFFTNISYNYTRGSGYKTVAAAAKQNTLIQSIDLSLGMYF